jgi:hypothetical protein
MPFGFGRSLRLLTTFGCWLGTALPVHSSWGGCDAKMYLTTASWTRDLTLQCRWLSALLPAVLCAAVGHGSQTMSQQGGLRLTETGGSSGREALMTRAGCWTGRGVGGGRSWGRSRGCGFTVLKYSRPMTDSACVDSSGHLSRRAVAMLCIVNVMHCQCYAGRTARACCVNLFLQVST